MAKEPAKEVVRGVTALGRSKTYKRRGLWAVKKKNGGKFPIHPKTAKAEVAAALAPRFYPADDVPKPLAHRPVVRPARLRSSISPGTILILLAGRFKGKRVVFLKQLPSGLLLVTGPFKVNGVPLRRVNQKYVIATSTKVTLPTLDLDKFTDAYFKPQDGKKSKKKKTESDFFETEQKKEPITAEYIQNQAEVDTALLSVLSEELQGYLNSRFTLKDGDRPHLLKF